jgi:MFS family permease
MSPPSSYERRWLLLALISIAQLMIVLDLTIVNIALPSAQQDLGFSNDERHWIIRPWPWPARRGSRERLRSR